MIRLGFSPCPNDTFIFYALANGKVRLEGIEFEFLIEDVETLNQLALKRMLDVTKISCHAFAHVSDDYRFLRAGGAFGRGCGPLIVAREPLEMKDLGGKSVAIPGELTTAFLLLKLCLASAGGLQPSACVVMPFHEIMDAVRSGRVDAGLIIHESRFTYPLYGLRQVIDLGEWWERETGLLIPLGGIAAKKSFGDSLIGRIEDCVRRSVQYAYLHREEAGPYIRRYARELSEEVIDRHISLYVNEYSLDSGDEGQAALAELLKRANMAIKERKA